MITLFIRDQGVYLLWVLSKAKDANLSKAQVNELAKIVKALA